ncbi:MAG TPA: protein-disulfide reductase DsbD domain-containing protein [Verrucomicrobiae bacterium]|nr:protein-disulfide reductase DsbD domain-containing protein [Verrucomicrobiae bacterium]
MQRIGIILSGWFCLMALTAHAAHTHVQLLLSADPARPGDTIWAGLDLKMDPDWHTYWKNPGEAGMATKIQWQLPPGVTAGDIQWPLPGKLPPAEVTTYGYSNEVMLLVPLKIAADLKPGMVLDLTAKVSWLECREECVPGSTTVAAQLHTGGKTEISADATTMDLWKSKVPQSGDRLKAQAWWGKPATGDQRPLILEWSAPKGAAAPDFFPKASDNFDIQAATENLPAGADEIRLRKPVQKFSGDWPKDVSGVIVMNINGQRDGFDVTMAVSDQAPAGQLISASSENPAGGTPVLPSKPLWRMLLYAFLGGLILNIMPCVLPVIALKILGFINHAHHEPGRVRTLGLVYAAGVLVSFLVLAAMVIGVKAAGRHAGWGMQFGSPVFIVCLTTLILLVALNLFGVFEVTLGGRTLSAAGQLASQPGAPGAFFNGILATALATPCTAPILATALGFAFLQNNPVIIALIFLFVGLGLAAPYVVLSWNPAWLKFLPKPGAWMEKFKIVMGFPMLATAVWLFNLAYGDYGKNVLWLGLFLVIVALAAWIFGEFVQRGRSGKGIAVVIVLILLSSGYAFALENQLHWRAPIVIAGTSGSVTDSPDGIDWQPWSPEAVTKAQTGGHPVLVDFTADWCVTCQVNKKIGLETPSVREKLKEINAVALVGDYTHFPDSITTELNRYGRAGVPLVLVYPQAVGAQPIVLPQILTPGIVVDALDRATRQ